MGHQRTRLSVEADAEQEEARAKAARQKPKVEKLKAQSVEYGSASPDLSSPQTTATPEQQAARLGDERFAGSAARGQVADAVVALQRQRGNVYVQKVVRHLQTSADNEVEEDILEKTVEELQEQKGAGHTIEAETRQEMEQALGYDLSQVRLHTDGSAHQAAHSLRAKAFTMGSDIFFSAREGHKLSSSEGKGLLAHELTHVVQQSQGNLDLPGRKVKMGELGDTYEREADRVAEMATRADVVQRQEEEEEVQMKAEDLGLQRQVEEEEEEEEAIQTKVDDLLQRQDIPEEEEEVIQTKVDDVLQQQEEEEDVQMKVEDLGLQRQEEIPEEEV